MAPVRVALVSPYSYTYPGGVGRHVEALAQELTGLGHEVRLLAPYDPDDRLARVSHRGAPPQRRPLPDHVVPLGRTMGFPMNGAVSNLAAFPETVGRAGAGAAPRRLRRRPRARAERPATSPGTRPRPPAVPIVGTFHTYTTSGIVSRVDGELLRRAAAVLEAERAHRRLGGRALDRAALLRRALPGDPERRGPRRRRARTTRGRTTSCASCSWAAPRSGRACPSCCAPSRRCAAWASTRGSRSPGPTPDEVEPLLLDPEGIEIAGQVDDDHKWELLGEADLLCAPSLGGESFGMVLTEAFASGTPVVASDIAGYRDVVRDGQDGMLVPVGDAVALGEALARAGVRPGAARRDGRRRARARRALRLAERRPRGRGRLRGGARRARAGRAAWRASRGAPAWSPTEPGPRVGPRRLPSLEPNDPAAGRRRVARAARRVLVAAGAVAGAGARRARASAARHRVDRARDRGRHARLGARGLRADVRVDAAPRRGLARDPARRPARHARPPARRRARRR